LQKLRPLASDAAFYALSSISSTPVPRWPNTTTGPIAAINSSLGANNNAINNVFTTSVNGDFETDGSGFANFKSELAGNTSASDPGGINTLTAFVFSNSSPASSTTGDGQPYSGFDGELFRGQIDNLGTYNGDLTVTVTFSDSTSLNPDIITHTFTGLNKENMDFWVLGFDEKTEPGKTVRSVVLSVEGDGGAWNQIKQLDFSVPGVVASVPEPSTWAMFIAGFGLLGFAAMRKGKREARLAV
jgi:hypothetical protein